MTGARWKKGHKEEYTKSPLKGGRTAGEVAGKIGCFRGFGRGRAERTGT